MTSRAKLAQSHVYFVRIRRPGRRKTTLRREDGTCSFLTVKQAQDAIFDRASELVDADLSIERWPPEGCRLGGPRKKKARP